MKFLFMSQPDYACNSYALFKYISDNTEHETAWLVNKEERFFELKKRGIECALYDTYSGNDLVESSDVIVSNSYTFRNVPKRPGQLFVNLWHGSGIKAHDYFHRDANPTYLRDIKKYLDNVDLMCVHSLDDRFRLSAMLNFDLRKSFVTGQPRLDCVVKSDGKKKLKRILGDKVDNFDRFVLYVPSFRANMSGHSGNIYSSNIFRLNDYDDEALYKFLDDNNALLIYKLHPIEQNAFRNRIFHTNDRCIELTDEALFENEMQYDELLNAFDVMITDYSSIAFDYLLLDRPLVYLLPDYEEYRSSKGFVFNNVDYYMPGDKAINFEELISALSNAFVNPTKYSKSRNNVIEQRFDYLDGDSSRRCYEAIVNYKPIIEKTSTNDIKKESSYPSAADYLKQYINDEAFIVIDGTKQTPDQEIEELKGKEIVYVIEEDFNEYTRISPLYKGKSVNTRKTIKFLQDENIHVCKLCGGVDYKMFSKKANIKPIHNRIGYAGTIDSRIYFAMVQMICEAFPDYEIVFAGEILGDYPAWLSGFDNLKYISASYEELPQIISSFEVCILPFYGIHQNTFPTELAQFMAMGKCVVTSDMKNLPECRSVFVCHSIDESIENIRQAQTFSYDDMAKSDEMKLSSHFDWMIKCKELLDGLQI